MAPAQDGRRGTLRGSEARGRPERRARKSFGFKVYPTIAETVRCGGTKLAVDGVLIIGEHGNYPHNEKGQILYPRYEFFRQVADVFESEGRAVPVFNDKHLSYSFAKAKAMVDASKRLRFPFLAGSSLPVTWRLPSVELPMGCEVEEALMVGVGGSDPMDFHALEAMQCMLERRRGGETGVRSVQLIEGDAVWKAGDQKRWSWTLLESALSRSDSLKGLTARDGRTQNLTAGRCDPEDCSQPGGLFHRLRRRHQGDAPHAQRCPGRLQLRRPGSRSERARSPASSCFLPTPMSPTRPASCDTSNP